uniref:Uncharacterized protein n=1 Tax=Setaria italica TaxID=4555 RepID=K4AL68_SETIT
MARSREVLLLLGLLVVGLLAAAPGDAAAVRGCQPEVLAPTVALFCAPGQPAKWCCQALVHSASVGGGARCLCRLAAEEPRVRAWLNGTELLRLYASCRAARGGHAGGGAPSYPPAPSVCGRGEGAPPSAAGAPVDTSGCATAGRRWRALLLPRAAAEQQLRRRPDLQPLRRLHDGFRPRSHPPPHRLHVPVQPGVVAGACGLCVKSWWLSAAGRPPRSSLNMSPMHRRHGLAYRVFRVPVVDVLLVLATSFVFFSFPIRFYLCDDLPVVVWTWLAMWLCTCVVRESFV